MTGFIYCHMNSFWLIKTSFISQGLKKPIKSLSRVKIKGRDHNSGERLLIIELNIQSYYTTFLQAPEAMCWLGRIVPGFVWSTMFVSHLQNQDCVQKLDYFLMENKERTGRGPWEAFVWDLIFDQ